MNKEAIEKVLDDFLEEYDKDHTVIYGSEHEKTVGYYRFVGKVLRLWKRSQKCIYNNCKNHSVKRSHTIQKSSSLRIIAEEGSVLTPEYILGGAILKEKGFSQASTFPGYCNKHERLFEEFENAKKITDSKHYVLQIYRSLCRELVRLRHEIYFLEKMIRHHEFERNSYIIKKIATATDIVFEQSAIKVKKDKVIHVLTDKLTSKKEQFKTLETYHLPEVHAAVEDPLSNNITAVTIEIDTMVPVCLSGLYSFGVEEKGVKKTVVSIVNVLPYKNSTFIVMHGRNEDENAIMSYLAHYNDSMSLLNMIEVWMVYGTDHWFLKPSVWATIPDERRKKILSTIDSDDDELEFPHSIFDDIRTKLIRSARKQINTPGKEQYFAAIIQNELKKL